MTDLTTLKTRRQLLAERIQNTQDPYLRENLLMDYLKLQTQIQIMKGETE